MRILVVNVNTTDSITQAIARQAQAAAAPGTEIIGLDARTSGLIRLKVILRAIWPLSR